MLAYIFNPSTQEAEEGKGLGISAQPGLHRDPDKAIYLDSISKKKDKEKEIKRGPVP